MKVIEIRDIEDCFDGSLIKELLLEDTICREQIMTLGTGCHLQYFPDFPRPFFKIRRDGIWDIKGIEGNSTMRIHLKSPDTSTLNDFLTMIEEI